MSPRPTKGIMSPEARRKMSEAHKRFYANPENRARWSGPNSSQWKGGRCKTGKLGYVMALCPGHPTATKRGYVLEHRLIMEALLGRYLRHDEHVHHINGIPSDNRPENLALMPEAEHHSLHTRAMNASRSERRKAIMKSNQEVRA